MIYNILMVDENLVGTNSVEFDVETVAENSDDEDVEDLAIEAHERLNALISVLLKKGTFTEEELEFEAFKQARED